MKRLLLIFTAFALPLGVHAQTPTHWDLLLKAADAELTDSLALFGVRSDASDDFESQYDIPRPPRPPSAVWLEVSFPHSGGAYPPILGTAYAVDMRGPVNPSWAMTVDASVSGPVTLVWDSAYMAAIDPHLRLYLNDLGSGAVVDMRVHGSYTFTYAGVRNFLIRGSLNVDLRYLMEGFWNGTVQVRDTVSAWLADAATPSHLSDSTQCFLSDTGGGILSFPRAASGSYYLVVRHRNHLEVWSASPLALVQSSTAAVPYDFAASAGAAFGVGATRLEGALYTAWGGDVNQDGVVDYRDRNLTWNDRTLSGYLATDCNGDGTTDSSDGAIVLRNRYKLRQHP